MDYEQFKERIEEELHQALADHGIDANFSQLSIPGDFEPPFR